MPIPFLILIFNFLKKKQRKKFDQLKKEEEFILKESSDSFCFYCGHDEHGLKMPSMKKVGESLEGAALRAGKALITDGNPLLSVAKFAMDLIPEDRCYGCRNNWVAQKSERLRLLNSKKGNVDISFTFYFFCVTMGAIFYYFYLFFKEDIFPMFGLI